MGGGRYVLIRPGCKNRRRRKFGGASRARDNKGPTASAYCFGNGPGTKSERPRKTLPTPTVTVIPADTVGADPGKIMEHFRCSFPIRPSQARPHGQWEQVYCPRGNMVSKRESMGGRGIFVVRRYPADRQPGGYIRPASGPTLNESISVAWACLVNRRRCWGRCKAGLQSARAPPQESVRLLPAHGPRCHARSQRAEYIKTAMHVKGGL